MASFTKQSAKRLARSTRFHESTPLYPVAQNPFVGFSGVGNLAITSTSITAWTAGTCGTGTADLQLLAADGTYAALSPTQTVKLFSMFSTSIPTSTLVEIGLVNGQWFVRTVSC